MFTLRRATLDDSAFLFEWRNDPLTRANSVDEDAVPWNVHIDWLTRSLSNPGRLLFVGVQGQPVGTSRLDLSDAHLEISYTVAPAHRQAGYGHALVRETLKHSDGPVKATVKPHNRASRRILEKADFQITGEENGLLVYMRK